MMKTLLVCLLTGVLLAACSRMSPPAAHSIFPSQSRTYKVPIHWKFFENQPAERKNESVDLQVSVNDRVAVRSTVSLKAGEARQEIELPDGVNEVTAEVVGQAAVHVAVAGKDGQSLALWLYRDSSKPPASQAVAPPGLLYELRDDSPPANAQTPSTAGMPELVPVVCTFYRDDAPAVPRGTEEVPLRIFFDERCVFDGVARSGTAAFTNNLFRVARGAHWVRVEVPGRVEQSAAIDAREPLWIKVHFTAGTTPAMRLIISNSMLGAF
jgi:hypothetical protein